MSFLNRPHRQFCLRVSLLLAIMGWAAVGAASTGEKITKPELLIAIPHSPDGNEGFKALRMRLVGVVNSSASKSPMALISMDGVEEDILVGVGDLLGGYTLLRIGSDQIELEKGEERQTLTIRNLRWVKADPKAKILHIQSPSPTSEPSETGILPRLMAQLNQKKSHTVSKSPTQMVSSVTSSRTSSSARPNFVRPMLVGRVSCPFGSRHALKTRTGMSSSNHKGTDIAAPSGTSVYASAAGTVRYSGYSSAKGYYIQIRHTGGYETCYYHLSKRYVKAGQVVKSRQRIGSEGSTGISTGPHLHFEIRRYGVATDASKFIDSLKYTPSR